MHGFSGATSVYDIAQDDDGRLLIALYVGDFDPSGMFMSEHDLPERLEKYGGDHVVADADRSRQAGPRHAFRPSRHPTRRRTLATSGSSRTTVIGAGNWTRWTRMISATCVEEEIKDEIEPVAWARCEKVNKAEQESLRSVLDSWKGAAS